MVKDAEISSIVRQDNSVNSISSSGSFRSLDGDDVGVLATLNNYGERLLGSSRLDEDFRFDTRLQIPSALTDVLSGVIPGSNFVYALDNTNQMQPFLVLVDKELVRVRREKAHFATLGNFVSGFVHRDFRSDVRMKQLLELQTGEESGNQALDALVNSLSSRFLELGNTSKDDVKVIKLGRKSIRSFATLYLEIDNIMGVGYNRPSGSRPSSSQLIYGVAYLRVPGERVLRFTGAKLDPKFKDQFPWAPDFYDVKVQGMGPGKYANTKYDAFIIGEKFLKYLEWKEGGRLSNASNRVRKVFSLNGAENGGILHTISSMYAALTGKRG